jgi:hypothetical protein
MDLGIRVGRCKTLGRGATEPDALMIDEAGRGHDLAIADQRGVLL